MPLSEGLPSGSFLASLRPLLRQAFKNVDIIKMVIQGYHNNIQSAMKKLSLKKQNQPVESENISQ